MTTCPNGHESADPDWCDTCGARLGAPPASAPASAPAVPGTTPASPSAAPSSAPAGLPAESGPTVACPNCGVHNGADSLFCEDCGYDFTTGQAPPAPPPAATPTPTSTPAEPADPGAGAAIPAVPAGSTEWAMIVEVDPAWFSIKGALADAPCPPTSARTVDLALSTASIGRSSESRNIHPDLALDADPGVSRRHAQLVRDGDQWTIADLGSTNGTHVVAGGATPTADTNPIAPNTATTLQSGDSILVGAWSRLTLVQRTATSGPPSA